MENIMRKSLALALALASLALPLTAQIAAAQNNEQGSARPNAGQSSSQDASPQALPQRLQTTLREAGFTDVEVMPSSFLVKAKDQQGHPIMMVINPDSLTVVTAISETPGDTTGQGSAGK
jgi:hypothetical protein